MRSRLVVLELLLAAVFSANAQTPTEPLKPMATGADPTFEVATIKPGAPESQGRGLKLDGHNFSALNFTLDELIVFAYDLQVKQLIGGTGWMDKDKFDISAVPDGEGQPSTGQWQKMVQKLLASRFHLTAHNEKREMPIYALRSSKNGTKLTKNDSGKPGPGSFGVRMAHEGMMLSAQNETMAEFSSSLQTVVVDRPVSDQTNLGGRFDFTLTFAPDGSEFGGLRLPASSDGAAAPGLFTAIQELGLKLDSIKAPVETLVIDHAEEPSAN